MTKNHEMVYPYIKHAKHTADLIYKTLTCRVNRLMSTSKMLCSALSENFIRRSTTFFIGFLVDLKRKKVSSKVFQIKGKILELLIEHTLNTSIFIRALTSK